MPFPKLFRARSDSPPWAQQGRAAAPWGNSPVRNLRPQQELGASCAGAGVGSAGDIRLAAAAVLAEAGVVGSRTASAGAAMVAAAAGEFPEAGRVLTAGRAAVAEAAVARRVLG